MVKDVEPRMTAEGECFGVTLTFCGARKKGMGFDEALCQSLTRQQRRFVEGLRKQARGK